MKAKRMRSRCGASVPTANHVSIVFVSAHACATTKLWTAMFRVFFFFFSFLVWFGARVPDKQSVSQSVRCDCRFSELNCVKRGRRTTQNSKSRA